MIGLCPAISIQYHNWTNEPTDRQTDKNPTGPIDIAQPTSAHPFSSLDRDFWGVGGVVLVYPTKYSTSAGWSWCKLRWLSASCCVSVRGGNAVSPNLVLTHSRGAVSTVKNIPQYQTWSP